jgi:hypothetical protein
MKNIIRVLWSPIPVFGQNKNASLNILTDNPAYTRLTRLLNTVTKSGPDILAWFFAISTRHMSVAGVSVGDGKGICTMHVFVMPALVEGNEALEELRGLTGLSKAEFYEDLK